jgi:hypothetical protein
MMKVIEMLAHSIEIIPMFADPLSVTIPFGQHSEDYWIPWQFKHNEFSRSLVHHDGHNKSEAPLFHYVEWHRYMTSEEARYSVTCDKLSSLSTWNNNPDEHINYIMPGSKNKDNEGMKYILISIEIVVYC